MQPSLGTAQRSTHSWRAGARPPVTRPGPYHCLRPATRARASSHSGDVEPTPFPAAVPAAGLSRRDAAFLVPAGLLVQSVLVSAAWSDSDITATPGPVVFVAGATGNTGRRVVQQLRAHGFRVRAGVRDLGKAKSLGFALDKGIELVLADVTGGTQLLEQALGDAQAVVCATGASGFGFSGPAQVDEQGTISLVDAAKARGVQHFVLLSSLLTNAVAVGQKDNGNFKFLNLFGNVLDHKLVAEKHLRASGLTWTIVRPGGLTDDPPEKVGRLIVSGEDTLFGLDGEPGREISRDTVAQVLVAALEQPSANNRVVEIVASPTAPELPSDSLFK